MLIGTIGVRGVFAVPHVLVVANLEHVYAPHTQNQNTAELIIVLAAPQDHVLVAQTPFQVISVLSKIFRKS